MWILVYIVIKTRCWLISALLNWWSLNIWWYSWRWLVDYRKFILLYLHTVQLTERNIDFSSPSQKRNKWDTHVVFFCIFFINLNHCDGLDELSFSGLVSPFSLGFGIMGWMTIKDLPCIDMFWPWNICWNIRISPYQKPSSLVAYWNVLDLYIPSGYD